MTTKRRLFMELSVTIEAKDSLSDAMSNAIARLSVPHVDEVQSSTVSGYVRAGAATHD